MHDMKTLKRSANAMIKLEEIETLIPTPAQSPAKRLRLNSYESPNSNQSSIASDDSFVVEVRKKPAKRRGRPPKTEPTVLSPTMSKNMSEEDWKYMVMRTKNNEASRRSRQNRRGQETEIFKEARELEENYEKLIKQENDLKKECNRWRRAVMRLAQL